MNPFEEYNRAEIERKQREERAYLELCSLAPEFCRGCRYLTQNPDATYFMPYCNRLKINCPEDWKICLPSLPKMCQECEHYPCHKEGNLDLDAIAYCEINSNYIRENQVINKII